MWLAATHCFESEIINKLITMGARSGQNSVYYFCPLSNYFYGVHLFKYMLELFLQVYELFVRG